MPENFLADCFSSKDRVKKEIFSRTCCVYDFKISNINITSNIFFLQIITSDSLTSFVPKRQSNLKRSI